MHRTPIAVLAMIIIVAASNYLVQFPINDVLTWGAFTYPLAALFAMTGIPFFWWSVGISLAVHAGIVIWLKTAPRLSPKKAICIALCVGMLDFLFVKIFPFPAQIMG